MASSLLLSFELIYFLSWLYKNEKKLLDSLIKKAANEKFQKDLETVNLTEGLKVSDEMYDDFMDFIDYMENSLTDKLDGKSKKTIRKKLNSSLNNLKLNNIDDQTIYLALKQAESEMSQDSSKQTKIKAKQILLDKILQNWLPSKEEEIN